MHTAVLLAGRSASCQRPAACCEWRVTFGKVQPRGHGDAAQVHVYGGEPERDDPACRSPSSSAIQPGRSCAVSWAASPSCNYSSPFCAFLAPLWSTCHSIEQLSHRCWLFIVWVPCSVQRFSLTEVRATPPGEAVSLHRGTKAFSWAYQPSLCVVFLLKPMLECVSLELNKGQDRGALVPHVSGIRKVGWILWGAKQHTFLTWLWLPLLLFLSLWTEPLPPITAFCCCYFAHTWILTSGAVWSIKPRV